MSDLARCVAEIKEDRGRGASELAGLAVETMARILVGETACGKDEFLKIANDTAGKLASARPSMAPIKNWVFSYYGLLSETLGEQPSAPFVGSAKIEILNMKADVLKRQVAEAKPILAKLKTIFTLSYSSTVLKVLSESAPEECKIVIAESRPLFEGRKLAQSLIEKKRKVAVVTDASMALAIKDASAVVLGADTVFLDGAFLNKTGSFQAALCAREFAKPLYVLADTFKINSDVSSENAVVENMDGSEVWSESPHLCRNVYFEVVPARFVTAYITEKGALQVPLPTSKNR